MKQPAIGVAARDFRHAIAIAGKTVERRNTIPILGMVRCRANGAFEATATDLDLTITAKVPRTGSRDAVFMLQDYRSVISAIAAAGGDTVALDAADGKVELSSDALRVELSGLVDAGDFPTGNEVNSEAFSATFSHEQIRSFARVAAAISTEETRYYLNGLYFHQLGGSAYRAVATDGHRMCFVDLVLPDATGALAPIIIPRKTIRILLEIAGKKATPGDEGIGMRVGSGVLRNSIDSTAPERPGCVRAEFHLGAGSAHVGLATKLIDGTFPQYERVIPQAPERSILFNRNELRRAVLAASFGSEKVRAVRLHFEPGVAIVSAAYLETGIGTSVRVACQHDWVGADLGVNGGYLLSMIDAAGGDEVLLRLTDPSTPILVRNPADTAWTGILMPMRL